MEKALIPLSEVYRKLLKLGVPERTAREWITEAGRHAGTARHFELPFVRVSVMVSADRTMAVFREL